MSDLTTKPIKTLIRQIAIPASIGFFFNTMYNIVDTYFAGQLGTQALAALGISFPVFFLIIASGSGLSQGTSALIANILGTGDKEKAQRYSFQALTYGVLLSIVLTIVGLGISEFLFSVLGASGQYLLDALAYMDVIMLGSVFFIITFVANGILNAHGDTKSFRNILIIGFFLNIILNPILMFGWWIFPELGIAGIALATVLIEAISAVYMLYRLSKHGVFHNITKKCIIPRLQIYKEISEQAVPAGFSMFSVAAGIFIITFFISVFGKIPVAAYGIATRIEQIVLLPSIGLNIATLTLVGQNNGAKLYHRVKDVYAKAIKYSLVLMTIGCVILVFFSRQLMSIFTDDAIVISTGTTYLHIAAFTLWAYPVLFISVSLLQGLKKPMYAMWLGLYRQIIAPIIILSLLVYVFNMGLLSVWWTIFGIVWSSVIIVWFITRSYLKNLGK
ncbi:MAG: putative MATE family efflux protein [Candidatus Woesearchaeota archaeon]|jgi:putative MATE family efflux protein